MKSLTPEEISSMTFPDFVVTSFTTNNSMVEFRVSGCHIAKPASRIAGPVLVTLTNWKNFRASKYNPEGPVPIKNSEVEPLKEICDCNLNFDTTFIAGFTTKSGEWELIEMDGAKIEASILDD